MEIVLLAAVLLLLCVAVLFSYKASRPTNEHQSVELKIYLEHIRSEFPKLDATIKSEISTNRYENSVALAQAREEISRSVTSFTGSINEKLDLLTHRIDQKLKDGAELAASHNKESRKELKENLDAFKAELSATLANFNERQRENFNNLTLSQDNQNAVIKEKISVMTMALQDGLKAMQDSNEKKLEEMRKTVDEKLHDTLEKRLGESFKFVSERLEAVHKGLGDMQSLANNVGDLKKVMSNVKSRGVLGEYQLLNILEDLLTNEQYEKNVKTKEGSGALVEFAIRMPNGRDTQKSLWLPIDSKFPKEDYEALVQAYDEGDHEKIELFRKAFRAGIIKNARDIQEKYINPPNTTEYGIMFLPFESLYAEVLRTPGLFESIQKDYKITVTGPTTLSALINSLQMGFRTLAIEKRSSEVWDLLGAVKTEFSTFGEILDKTQKKLQEASNVIDKAGVRTRAIERKLRKVQELPSDQSIRMIDEIEDTFGEDNSN